MGIGMAKAECGLIHKLSIAVFVLFCTDLIHTVGLLPFQMVSRAR